MTPTYLMLHHTKSKDGATHNWNSVRRWHMGLIQHPDNPYLYDPMDDIGYHYGYELIGKTYEILTGRMMNETGAHARQDYMNHRALGLAVVGDFDLGPPPNDLWWLIVRHARSLIDVIPTILPDNIKGHREVAPHKTCPGRHFDLDQFRRDVVNMKR